jgi:hypothetical protein
MAHICKNCGAELFDNQRFCRSCGRPTGDIGDSPTQVMPPSFADGQPGGGSQDRPQANTTPQPAPATGPVYAHQQSYYAQPPPMQVYPGPSGRRWGWIATILGIGGFAALFLVVFLFARAARLAKNKIGERIRDEMGQRNTGLPRGEALSDEGATVTSTETVWVRTVDLDGDSGSTVYIRNERGNIQIQGWDKPQAEVRVVKRGGSAEERGTVPVYFSSDTENLSVQTSGAGRIEVSYQIKLPRLVGKLSLDSINSGMSVSGVAGAITAKSVNGPVDLSGVSGEVIARTTNGGIKAVFNERVEGQSLTFKSTNGSIDLLFKAGVDADLTAHSTSGDIQLPSEFGLDVQRRPGSRRVEGKLGDGGSALRIDTTTGSIRLSKQ